MIDEKDARSYLQALAAKMTDELDSLKMSGTPAGVSKIHYSVCYMFISWHVWSFRHVVIVIKILM